MWTGRRCSSASLHLYPLELLGHLSLNTSSKATSRHLRMLRWLLLSCRRNIFPSLNFNPCLYLLSNRYFPLVEGNCRPFIIDSFIVAAFAACPYSCHHPWIGLEDHSRCFLSDLSIGPSFLGSGCLDITTSGRNSCRRDSLQDYYSYYLPFRLSPSLAPSVSPFQPYLQAYHQPYLQAYHQSYLLLNLVDCFDYLNIIMALNQVFFNCLHPCSSRN